MSFLSITNLYESTFELAVFAPIIVPAVPAIAPPIIARVISPWVELLITIFALIISEYFIGINISPVFSVVTKIPYFTWSAMNQK